MTEQAADAPWKIVARTYAGRVVTICVHRDDPTEDSAAALPRLRLTTTDGREVIRLARGRYELAGVGKLYSDDPAAI